MRVRRRQIREAVDQLLRQSGTVSPAVDVEAIAKLHGITVQRQKVEDSFSGFLLRDNQSGTVVIGVNAQHPPVRRRFTIAHELGHFFLHEHEKLRVDQGTFVINRRDARSSTGTDIQEIEANAFAAELLMPEEFILRDIEELNKNPLADHQLLCRMADRYDVSEPAMAIRLSNLGFISI
jgi:Zn-dependent peptidase ImmA (M78 family)